jgi:hypothetical protein
MCRYRQLHALKKTYFSVAESRKNWQYLGFSRSGYYEKLLCQT